MSSLADLRSGDIGLGPTGGGAGILIDLAQRYLSQSFDVGKTIVEHVFVVTGWRPRGDDEMMAVEAMPGGAVEVNIADRWTPEYAYVRLPEDYPGQAADAAAIARAMIGTPYSFASYAALAAWRFGWKTPKLERWIDRRRPEYLDWSQLPPGANGRILANVVANFSGTGREVPSMHLPAEAICSVLADQAWALTGKQVMPEGTPHQCVTPGALAKALLEKPGVEWLWPA